VDPCQALYTYSCWVAACGGRPSSVPLLTAPLELPHAATGTTAIAMYYSYCYILDMHFTYST
jgi:hypothetical protein